MQRFCKGPTPGISKLEETEVREEGQYSIREDIQRKQQQIDEAERENERMAEEKYKETQDPRVFDDILAPFFEADEGEVTAESSWIWIPEVERWSCQSRGISLWCPPPESFQ